MYHIFLNEEAVHSFAQQLVQSEHFQDGTFSLYADVPVKCLGYEAPFYPSNSNLKDMDKHTAAQTVDFMVTKGTEVILGITFEIMANKSKKLFSSVLKGLPHFSAGSDGQGSYSKLYLQVLDHLAACLAPDCPKGSFSLTAVTVEQSTPELFHMHLLQPNGTTSHFGRECGLFFQYKAGGSGVLEKMPVTSSAHWEDYLAVVNWNRGISEDSNADALQALLDVSIGELYQDDSADEAWNELNEIMAALIQLKSYPSFAPSDTLVDYLELVYRLIRKYGDGNPENEQILCLCRRLLSCLAIPLCADSTADRFEILRMPIQGYFDEAALFSNLYYPKWLYQANIAPYLNTARFPCHTMSELLKYTADCCLPSSVLSCPTLYEILVAPVCHSDLLH